MAENQTESISPYWQDKLKEFHNEHAPDIRIQTRLQGEQDAKSLLEGKLGQFDKTDLKVFLEDLNRDWWQGKERKDRCFPAFSGFLAIKIIESLDAFNK